MLFDIRTNMFVFILKLTIYVPTSRQISLPINNAKHEDPMYNVNSCHAVASHYSSETLLRTQTVTVTATFPNCMVERTPRKLETATHPLLVKKNFP